ncbi:hypothetical protein HW517_03090 [Asaia spathodeae]
MVNVFLFSEMESGVKMKKITFEEAREIASLRIRKNVVDSKRHMGREVPADMQDILLDEAVIIGKRFWFFFWDPEAEVFPAGLSWLGSGIGCLITDRGDVRDHCDIRRMTPERFEKQLVDIAAWAERPDEA